MISKFPEVLNFNRLFLKLNQFISNEPPVLPGHGWDHIALMKRPDQANGLHSWRILCKII